MRFTRPGEDARVWSVGLVRVPRKGLLILMLALSNATRHVAFVSLLSIAGVVTGCSSDHKTQKQAATEEWNHTRATVLCSLAKDQYNAGNFDKCRETLNGALPLDPKNVQLLLLAARVDIEQGRLDTAQQRLTLAGEVDPKDGEVDYLVGVVQQRWQRIELARDAYARAAAKQPNDVAYLLAQAEMTVELDDLQGALALLQARSTYFEHSAAIRDAIGQLLEQSGDLAGAIEFYRQASVLDANDAGSRERLAMALYQQGSYREALAQFNRLVREPEVAKRNDLQMIAAECELALGLAADARHRFDLVVTREPADAIAWLGLAKSSLALNDVRRADHAISRAAHLPPTAGMASTYTVMGYVRVRQGRFDDAARCFRRASDMDPRDTTSMSMLGFALAKMGQTEEARLCYAQVLSMNPKDELTTQLMSNMTSTASAAGE